jgi:ankyrin repeat protein
LGNTALFYAVQNMHLDTLNLLLNMGADVNRKCELGNTALHQALMVGYKIDKNVKIINTLVLSGANNKLRNDFG